METGPPSADLPLTRSMASVTVTGMVAVVVAPPVMVTGISAAKRGMFSPGS